MAVSAIGQERAIHMPYITLNVSLSVTCNPLYPDDYLHDCRAQVVYFSPDPAGRLIRDGIRGNLITIGSIEGFLADGDVWRQFPAGYLFDHFDDRSIELVNIYRHLIDGNRLRGGLTHSSSSGVLHIERFLVEPAYRNRGIGRTVLRQFVRVAGRTAAIVVLQPFPIEARAAIREGEKRLAAFYEVVGFRKLEDSPYMYCDPDWLLGRGERKAR